MPRLLTPEEIDLIAFILGRGSNLPGRGDLVEEMNDGRMGSLRFIGSQDRRFGKRVGSAEFNDADGTLALLWQILLKTGCDQPLTVRAS